MAANNRQVLAMIIVLAVLTELCDSITRYQFKQYTYRKKRDDKRYKMAHQRCEMEAHCHGLWGIAYTTCLRKCMSEFCYSELYGEDELEEGEIDVRLNSFKGCLSQVKMEEYF
ncbi:unnamed protein product [Candidula unifasciata]|uniref:Uncharacterized protein n=1 Tax=Candidula unifasciata TaxID=100452 RepID=A0A8S3ZT06_9EUPU|nr:unnamed protein product [Candidula unifasciata]